MTGYSITTLRAPFFRWHAVITVRNGPVITVDPMFGRRRAQEHALRYADGFIEYRVNVELGPKASSSDDVRDALRKAIGVTSGGKPLYSPAQPDVGGTIDEDATDAVMDAAANEIEALQAERDAAEDTCEKLMALITAWVDAEDDWESICSSRSPDDFIYNEPEVSERHLKAIDALRKAVGR